VRGCRRAWQKGHEMERRWKLSGNTGKRATSAELAGFLETSMRQFGHASLPFVSAAHDEPGQAWRAGSTLRRLSHQSCRQPRQPNLQGRAFLSSAEKIFRGPANRAAALSTRPFRARFWGGHANSWSESFSCGALVFLSPFARTWSAQRSGWALVGPMEGQAVQCTASAPSLEIL
jgi:hypothetical protein